MIPPAPIPLSADAVANFCQRHGIARLALFGSVLRDDFNPQSDIDVLVDFLPERVPGLIRLCGMQRELSQILGRAVDLNTPEDLSRYFVDEVLREAQPIYVAA